MEIIYYHLIVLNFNEGTFFLKRNIMERVNYFVLVWYNVIILFKISL
jgi:hypothetical protein